MKYEVEFNNNDAKEKFEELINLFYRSEVSYQLDDLKRNVRNVCSFCEALRKLNIYGADTDVGVYDKDGFDRIGFARINKHKILENGNFDFNGFSEALAEIAGEADEK